MKERLLKLIGYKSVSVAKGMEVFDHHGSYYGVPIYMGDIGGQTYTMVKWVIMEPVFDLFEMLEPIMRRIFYGEDNVCFQFTVGKPFNQGDSK